MMIVFGIMRILFPCCIVVLRFSLIPSPFNMYRWTNFLAISWVFHFFSFWVRFVGFFITQSLIHFYLICCKYNMPKSTKLLLNRYLEQHLIDNLDMIFQLLVSFTFLHILSFIILIILYELIFPPSNLSCPVFYFCTGVAIFNKASDVSTVRLKVGQSIFCWLHQDAWNTLE